MESAKTPRRRKAKVRTCFLKSTKHEKEGAFRQWHLAVKKNISEKVKFIFCPADEVGQSSL